MKIQIKKHKQYLSVEIDADKELPKIIAWLDKQITEKRNMWLENANPNKMTEDFFLWKFLVTTFNELPDGKKTKAFIYQMLVLNDIVNDGQNNKSSCWIRNKHCYTQERWIDKLDHTWSAEDTRDICGNLAICLRLPDVKLFPFCHNFPETLTEVSLDDRILNVKE